MYHADVFHSVLKIMRACLINAEKKKLNNPASTLMKFGLVNLKSYHIGVMIMMMMIYCKHY